MSPAVSHSSPLGEPGDAFQWKFQFSWFCIFMQKFFSHLTVLPIVVKEEKSKDEDRSKTEQMSKRDSHHCSFVSPLFLFLFISPFLCFYLCFFFAFLCVCFSVSIWVSVDPHHHSDPLYHTSLQFKTGSNTLSTVASRYQLLLSRISQGLSPSF